MQSKQATDLLNRGRFNLDEFDDDEFLQFEHLYIISLNTFEGWECSVQEHPEKTVLYCSGAKYQRDN